MLSFCLSSLPCCLSACLLTSVSLCIWPPRFSSPAFIPTHPPPFRYSSSRPSSFMKFSTPPLYAFVSWDYFGSTSRRCDVLNMTQTGRHWACTGPSTPCTKSNQTWQWQWPCRCKTRIFISLPVFLIKILRLKNHWTIWNSRSNIFRWRLKIY